MSFFLDKFVEVLVETDPVGVIDDEEGDTFAQPYVGRVVRFTDHGITLQTTLQVRARLPEENQNEEMACHAQYVGYVFVPLNKVFHMTTLSDTDAEEQARILEEVDNTAKFLQSSKNLLKKDVSDE